MKAERQALESGQPVTILKNIRVSSVVQEVVSLRPIISDRAFEDKKLIRSILLSRQDVDYRALRMGKFMEMDFNHPMFRGKGRHLIAKHLGILWGDTAADYDIFIQDILGDYLYYDLHVPIEKEIEQHRHYFDETAEQVPMINIFVNPIAKPDDGFTREDFTTTLNAIFKKLRPSEVEVLKLFFGFEGEAMQLEDIGDKLDYSKERVRQVLMKGLKKLREGYISKQLRYGLGLNFRTDLN